MSRANPSFKETRNSKISPPFRKQKVRPPGLEYKLDPRPRYEARAYQGSKKLEDKIALITGGDSGIGRAVGVLFAREDAEVAFTYLPVEEKDALETQAQILEEGHEALAIKTDFESRRSCAQVIKEVVDKFGRIDILVNNAAFQNHLKIDELSEDQFEYTFWVNIFTPFRMIKAALPYMSKGSCIINTGSVLGYEGSGELIDYASTKGALHTFTKSLAKSLAERSIRVNSVAPGPVWTPLNPAERSSEGIKNFGSKTVFGRPAQPEEIAPAYVYLASSVTGGYITGETINLFGTTSGAN